MQGSESLLNPLTYRSLSISSEIIQVDYFSGERRMDSRLHGNDPAKAGQALPE